MSDDALRDDRQRGWFWAEDTLIDEYGPEIGVYGVAVYCLLARMADSKGVSWPSYNYIAKKLKISRSTAMRTITLLIDKNLISVEEKFVPTPDGNHVQKSNNYTLKNLRGGGVTDTPRGVADTPGVVSQIDGGGVTDTPEGNTMKETHMKEERNGSLSYLDKNTRHTVETLLSIKNWDKNEGDTLTLVSLAMKTFPHVDVLGTAKSLTFKIATGAARPYKKPSKAFSNWIAGASQKSQPGQPEPVRIRSREI